MNVLFAVIDDLLKFALASLFGFRSSTPADREREYQPQLGLPPPRREEPYTKTLLSINKASRATDEFKVGEQYFVSEQNIYLYSDPVIAFDTAITELHYGESVLLKKIGGRWAEVATSEKQGWILKDVLALRREDIFPVFTPGVIYDAHHIETIKLRNCIADQFGGAQAHLPLQSAEYVTYKLQSHKITIDWTSESPRVPGSWQVRLRGVDGVYMNVLPKTHAVMEYSLGEEGHLAFVEAVFPDRSIKISEIGFPEEGEFRELILSQEEYRELLPVFISVS